MSVRNVKFSFVSFGKVEAHYSLELQGYLTKEEFDQRIRELNEAGRVNRRNRFLMFLPLLIMLLVIAIVLPLIISRQVTNVRPNNNDFDFEDFRRRSQNSFMTWLWAVVIIFVGFTLGIISVSFLNYRSRVKQYRALTNKLDEFNVIYNPRGINWRIESNYHYGGHYNHNYNYNSYRAMYTEKYLVIEIGSLYSFTNNQMTSNPQAPQPPQPQMTSNPQAPQAPQPQMTFNPQAVNNNISTTVPSPPPPAYNESIKN